MLLIAVQKSKNHCGANDLSVTVINTVRLLNSRTVSVKKNVNKKSLVMLIELMLFFANNN
jgi:hypothetical protein